MLTGEAVFDGLSVGEVMLQQLRTLPEKPSVRLGQPVSADLEDVLMRCLAKKPADRPASAEWFEAALGRCAAAESWNREQAREWWQKLESAKVAKTMVMAGATAR